MTRICGLSCLVCALLVATASAQDSLCDPCVDPPLNRSLLPEPDEPEAAGNFDLGASISRLRSFEPQPGRRQLILVDGAAPAAAGERSEDDPAPEAASAESAESDDSAESSPSGPSPDE